MKNRNVDLCLKGKIFEAPFLYGHTKQKSSDQKKREYMITECFDNFVMAKQLSNGVPTSFTYTDLRDFGVISIDEWHSWVSHRSTCNILM